MSKAQFDAFYKKVGEDEKLKKKLMELRGPSKTVYPKIVQTAKAEGYDVTLADFKDAFSKESGKLDDAALAQVAGGCNTNSCAKVCGENCSDNLGTYVGQQ
ncbi:MAG: Nif11-like leader peptide family RiPP precursor [Bacillota bacterium]